MVQIMAWVLLYIAIKLVIAVEQVEPYKRWTRLRRDKDPDSSFVMGIQ